MHAKAVDLDADAVKLVVVMCTSTDSDVYAICDVDDQHSHTPSVIQIRAIVPASLPTLSSDEQQVTCFSLGIRPSTIIMAWC